MSINQSNTCTQHLLKVSSQNKSMITSTKLQYPNILNANKQVDIPSLQPCTWANSEWQGITRSAVTSRV